MTKMEPLRLTPTAARIGDKPIDPVAGAGFPDLSLWRERVANDPTVIRSRTLLENIEKSAAEAVAVVAETTGRLGAVEKRIETLRTRAMELQELAVTAALNATPTPTNSELANVTAEFQTLVEATARLRQKLKEDEHRAFQQTAQANNAAKGAAADRYAVLVGQWGMVLLAFRELHDAALDAAHECQASCNPGYGMTLDYRVPHYGHLDCLRLGEIARGRP